MEINSIFLFRKCTHLLSYYAKWILGMSIVLSYYNSYEKILIPYFFVYGIMLLELSFDTIAICKYIKIYGMYFENYSPDFEVWRYSNTFFLTRKIINMIKIIIQVFVSCYTIGSISKIESSFFQTFLIFLTVESIVLIIYNLIFSANTFYIIWNIQNFHANMRDLIQLTRNVSHPAEESCTICLEEKYNIEWCELPCKHKYHYECVKPWTDLNNNCPICRQ